MHVPVPLPVPAGRISHQHYEEALLGLASGRRDQVSCFICGPPPLIEAATESLTALGVPEDSIHFERWW